MNVILIINDTFRRDHLGCYGNTWIQTPNLDRFAEHAAIFDQCYISSYPTVPQRWDISTGRFGFPYRGWQPLDPGDVTLAQMLGRRGMHTQIIWDTPMLGMHDYNYTRGFKGVYFVHGQKGDPWITDPSLPVRLPAQPHKIKNLASMDGYLRNHHGRRHEREYCVARSFGDATEWLETNYTHDSFFLYIDMWDPHEPFDCPRCDYELYGNPKYSGDRMMYPQYGRPTVMTEEEHDDARALYAGNATLVDRWAGKFFDAAERLGLFDDTLIIWTTDHGHLFGEHDLQGKPGAEFGKLYEITARIPMLVHHPEGLGAGEHIAGIVQPPDVLPSILGFLGAPVPEQVEGKSFWPLVSGSGKIRDYAFSNRYTSPTRPPDDGASFDGWVGTDRVIEPSTVSGDEWTYICAPQGFPSELYNLKEDPEQLHNVVDEQPEIAEGMRKEWLDFLESHGASAERIRPFLEGNAAVHASPEDALFAFRDDRGQWIAFTGEEQARMLAHREDAPGPEREVEEITFGALLEDNPRNLIHLFDQFYWAEDLV